MKDYCCRIYTDLTKLEFEFSTDNLDDVISKIQDTYGNSVKRILFYELVRDIDFGGKS